MEHPYGLWSWVFAGLGARQWFPESWTSRFLSPSLLGGKAASPQGFLTPNFLADAAAKAAPSVVNISIHGNGSAIQVTRRRHELAVVCVLHVDACTVIPCKNSLSFCRVSGTGCISCIIES